MEPSNSICPKCKDTFKETQENILTCDCCIRNVHSCCFEPPIPDKSQRELANRIECIQVFCDDCKTATRSLSSFLQSLVHNKPTRPSNVHLLFTQMEHHLLESVAKGIKMAVTREISAPLDCAQVTNIDEMKLPNNQASKRNPSNEFVALDYKVRSLHDKLKVLELEEKVNKLSERIEHFEAIHLERVSISENKVHKANSQPCEYNPTVLVQPQDLVISLQKQVAESALDLRDRLPGTTSPNLPTSSLSPTSRNSLPPLPKPPSARPAPKKSKISALDPPLPISSKISLPSSQLQGTAVSDPSKCSLKVAEPSQDFFISHLSCGTTMATLTNLLTSKGVDPVLLKPVPSSNSDPTWLGFHVRTAASVTNLMLSPDTWPPNVSCDYYQNVRRGLTSAKIWGTNTDPSLAMLAAQRSILIRIEGCHSDVTPDSIGTYLAELNIDGLTVTSIPDDKGCFLIKGPFKHSEVLMATDTWPSGISFGRQRPRFRSGSPPPKPVTSTTTN